MKLLIFAHTPPPHHGQSYMVKLMLDGFGGDSRRRKIKSADGFGIECYHVNARFSKSLEDIGEFQGAKIFLIFWFCAQAVWCRFRHGATYFYYVPAPGKAMALYRDWLVMLLCRPFFKKIILHWHAAGLAKWLETSVQIRSRAVTYRLFKPVDLSIVLSRYNFADAEKLLSRHVRRRAATASPTPGPGFCGNHPAPAAARALPRRQKILKGENLQPPGKPPARPAIRQTVLLFLAHCTREKGVFDTVARDGALARTTNSAAENSPLRFRSCTLVGEIRLTEAEAGVNSTG
jgi:hypothetical protein